jgi:hypothetical protein
MLDWTEKRIAGAVNRGNTTGIGNRLNRIVRFPCGDQCSEVKRRKLPRNISICHDIAVEIFGVGRTSVPEGIESQRQGGRHLFDTTRTDRSWKRAEFLERYHWESKRNCFPEVTAVLFEAKTGYHVCAPATVSIRMGVIVGGLPAQLCASHVIECP